MGHFKFETILIFHSYMLWYRIGWSTPESILVEFFDFYKTRRKEHFGQIGERKGSNIVWLAVEPKPNIASFSFSSVSEAPVDGRIEVVGDGVPFAVCRVRRSKADSEEPGFGHFILPNVKDERDGYLARSVRKHDP